MAGNIRIYVFYLHQKNHPARSGMAYLVIEVTLSYHQKEQ